MGVTWTGTAEVFPAHALKVQDPAADLRHQHAMWALRLLPVPEREPGLQYSLARFLAARRHQWPPAVSGTRACAWQPCLAMLQVVQLSSLACVFSASTCLHGQLLKSCSRCLLACWRNC